MNLLKQIAGKTWAIGALLNHSYQESKAWEAGCLLSSFSGFPQEPEFFCFVPSALLSFS